MMRSFRVISLIIVLILIFPLFNLVRAQNSSTNNNHNNSNNKNSNNLHLARMVALCKLWGFIKYYHPYLAYRNIDWDRALVDAIPKIDSAKNNEELASAIQEMLNSLGDPATKVLINKKSDEDKATNNRKSDNCPCISKTEDKILVVKFNNYQDLSDEENIAKKLEDVKKELAGARAVIFDIRINNVSSGLQGGLSYILENAQILSLITTKTQYAPGERARMHLGFPSQYGANSGGYKTSFYVTNGNLISPIKGSKELPIVYVTNENGEVPSAILALHNAQKAAIIFEGNGSDESLIKLQRIEVIEGVNVQVRLTELINDNGTGFDNVDQVIAKGTGSAEQTYQAALALARNFKVDLNRGKLLPSRPFSPFDRPYGEMRYPNKEYRLLSVFRAWNVIQYFYPYKQLLGEFWEAVLEEFIPKIEAAQNEQEYVLTIMEMMTHTHDSHTIVNSAIQTDIFGLAPPPFFASMVENKLVITGYRNRDAAKAANIEVGDIIIKVDEEEANVKLFRVSKYISASTPQALFKDAAQSATYGKQNGTVKYTLQDRNGKIKEASVECKFDYYQGSSIREGDIIKILPDNIGYVDLDRLPYAMVDEMFEKLKDTKAIIFDMRGYPQGTGFAIAPRLGKRESPVAAVFYRPVLLLPDNYLQVGDNDTKYQFFQRVDKSDKWHYKNRTVMLINEEAQSQAEHTGLLFRAANDTKFIGSGTAGANGDITNFYLPGNLLVFFTGHDVRFPDGSQLQRIGLKPDVLVVPTIRGIQNGRDEVLEKAVEYLKSDSGNKK